MLYLFKKLTEKNEWSKFCKACCGRCDAASLPEVSYANACGTRQSYGRLLWLQPFVFHVITYFGKKSRFRRKHLAHSISAGGKALIVAVRKWIEEKSAWSTNRWRQILWLLHFIHAHDSENTRKLRVVVLPLSVCAWFRASMSAFVYICQHETTTPN